jgi:hypothetical protein
MDKPAILFKIRWLFLAVNRLWWLIMGPIGKNREIRIFRVILFQ